MDEVLALDCTLRDGGYCNNWCFRENNIRGIISALISANIDIVECGFLTHNVEYAKDYTKYTSLKQLDSFLPQHNRTSFVVMINYGEYNIEHLPLRSDVVVSGIRVAFHKNKMNEALEFCQKIREKGYEVFIQPMVTMLYDEGEYRELIEKANGIKPYAFYIVDSFGTMTENDVRHYFDIANEWLDEDIIMGFHAHNNLQSAYSNARVLLNNQKRRKLIIDSSIYGMGRGAGNLNSELFLRDLNTYYGGKYDVKPLLSAMDEILTKFYKEKPWGYSLPNYLSAVHLTHPNYAKYLTEKDSLLLADIDDIFSMMDADKALEYDEEYISELYLKYMSTGEIRNGHLFELKKKTKNKKVLLVGPGKSVINCIDSIKEFISKEKPIVISINHDEPSIKTDYIFTSNIRRFKQLKKELYSKTITTSNIKTNETYISVDYYKLLNMIEGVQDNAGLMAIKFVIDELNASDIYIAGLDGYTKDAHENYDSEELVLYTADGLRERMNEGMKEMIKVFRKTYKIEFLTPTLLEP